VWHDRVLAAGGGLAREKFGEEGAMTFQGFFAELKCRNVMRAAAFA
jgi:hypothetical protein